MEQLLDAIADLEDQDVDRDVVPRVAAATHHIMSTESTAPVTGWRGDFGIDNRGNYASAAIISRVGSALTRGHVCAAEVLYNVDPQPERLGALVREVARSKHVAACEWLLRRTKAGVSPDILIQCGNRDMERLVMSHRCCR